MKCTKCSKNAVNSGLCREHYIEEIEKVYLDNTSCDANMGILKWLKYMYPEHYRNSFNKAHIEVYLMLLRLYDPRYINKQHRLRELIAFRGFSKSKIIFGLISYLLAHNGQTMKIKSEDGNIWDVAINEKYIVLFSETATMAEEFVTNIRDEFVTNPRLKYFYKFQIEEAIDDITGQWTRKAFKINGCYIVGLGAKQQARGKIKGAYRPTFAFFDDIYSENNTITPESRYSIKNWFYNSAINTVDDLVGKVFLVGTIVHEDTVIVECERSNTWKHLKYYPIPLEQFNEIVSKELKVNLAERKCILPFDDIEDEFIRISKQKEYFDKLNEKYDILWKDRIGLYELILKYQEAVENMNLGGFYREYFHQIVPQELKKFRREFFKRIEGTIFTEYGYTWFKEENKDPILVNIEFGLDIAGGKVEGDNTVITVLGLTADNRYIVIEQIYGKLSIRDRVSESGLLTKGYIDEALRLYEKYKPLKIKVGLGGGHEGAIIEEFRRVFQSKGIYTLILPRPQNRSEGEKFERIERTLLPKYEAGIVYHLGNLSQLEYELEFLRKAKNDDCADALEVAMWNILSPPNIPYKLFGNEKRKKKINNEIEKYDWLLA